MRFSIFLVLFIEIYGADELFQLPGFGEQFVRSNPTKVGSVSISKNPPKSALVCAKVRESPCPNFGLQSVKLTGDKTEASLRQHDSFLGVDSGICLS